MPICYALHYHVLCLCATMRHVRRPKISYQTQNTALSRWDTPQVDTPKTQPGVQEDRFLMTSSSIQCIGFSFWPTHTLVLLPKLDPSVCFASSNTIQCNLNSINEYYSKVRIHVQGCKNHLPCINTNKIWTVQKSCACSGMTSRTMSVLPLEI